MIAWAWWRKNWTLVTAIVGLILIETDQLPLIKNIVTGKCPKDALPLQMFLQIQAGLCFFLVNDIKERNWFYVTANGIGFTVNGIVICLILWM